jgi:hypothetical protein
MIEEKNINLEGSLNDLNQKYDESISQQELKTHTEEEFDIDNFEQNKEENYQDYDNSEMQEKKNLSETFNYLEKQNIENFQNVKHGSTINIIKEGGESSHIEKNNELLSQMHNDMKNLNGKLDVLYQNEGITESELEENVSGIIGQIEESEEREENRIQEGGDVNASIQDNFDKFKEDNFYENKINEVNDNIEKEKVGANGSYEIEDFDDFDDLEIVDHVGELTDILIKQDRDKLQVDDDVLFEMFVNNLSLNPELMFNNQISPDKRTFGYIKIQDTSGKVSLPKFLYKTYERKEGGDHKTIHDYVNELIIMKNYLKHPQNYLEKIVENITSLEMSNRNLNLYYIKPIILNRKIIFKNNANPEDDIYENLTWYRDQKKYIDELSKYNPKKFGGLTKKKYSDAIRGRFTLLRDNKYQIFDPNFLKDENISNIEKLYVKNERFEYDEINTQISSDKSLIGHSNLNHFTHNTNNASVFYVNNVDRFTKNMLSKPFSLKERKLGGPVYEYFFNEEDNNIIKKNKIPGEPFNIVGYFVYSFDYNKRKNIDKYDKLYIRTCHENSIFLNYNEKEIDLKWDNDLINEEIEKIINQNNNLVICFNNEYGQTIIREYLILLLKKIFGKIFSLENILEKYKNLLKYSIDNIEEVKDFLSCYNINFHEIDKIHINFFRNLFTNKALDTLESVLKERDFYQNKLDENKDEIDNVKYNIQISDKYPIKYSFENTLYDSDFRRFLFLKQNIDNGLLNINYTNTTETIKNLNTMLEISNKELNNLSDTYNKLFKEDKCQEIYNIDNKNDETIKFNKEKIGAYYTKNHSIEIFKNLDNYSQSSNLCNLNFNKKNEILDCHFNDNCNSIPNFHLKYKINYYKNLINILNDRIELCKTFDLDKINHKLNSLINYNENYSKNKINNLEKVFLMDYSATSLYFAEDMNNIDLHKIGALLRDNELDKDEVTDVSIGADDDVEMDGFYKQVINGKTVVAESGLEISNEDLSIEYQEKIDKFNFNLLKKIMNNPNYSCELISKEFKSNDYNFICNKIKSFIIKLKLNMNIEDIKKLVFDIHKEYEDLPSYEYYKKVKYGKSDEPEFVIRDKYNKTYGIDKNKLGLIKSSILIARLCIELETRNPPYAFNPLYIIKESDKKIGGKDTETVSFIENKINFLVYVGSHKAKLGDSGIIMYNTQTTILENIVQNANTYYDKFLEDIYIKQLFTNRELYENKQEFLVSKEQYINHQNYSFNYIFSDSNDVNNTIVDNLIKKLENESMLIEDNYINNIINNKKYDVFLKLKDILRARYRYLNYYEMYLILKIIYNDPKYKLKGHGYGPEKYGMEAGDCITNGTCCYSYFPEEVEKYYGYTQIFQDIDNKFDNQISKINNEIIKLEVLNNLGIGRTVMYSPTHSYRNFVVYDIFTMKYKFTYNENDAKLFYSKYCKTDEYIKGVGGFNGLISLDYHKHIKQYCNNNNLLVSDVEQIVKILNNLNLKYLEDNKKQDFYNYYKSLFNVSDDNQESLNNFMNKLESNLEIESNIFNRFKKYMQNKLGYYQKIFKTKDFKSYLENNNMNKDADKDDDKDTEIINKKNSYLNLKYPLESIKNTSVKDSLRRMREHNDYIVKSNSDKQRLNNLKKIFIEFRVYMNLLKKKFNITINNYKLKKYSDDSTNGDYIFKHMKTFDIGLYQPLFVPTYSNKNILNLKNTDLIYNKFENIEFMKDLLKYSDFFQEFEFLYDLDDIDKVFGESSLFVGKRRIKESRYSNRVAGDIILIYIIQELDNLFNKANEIQDDNPKLNILSNVCKFMYEFLEQQADNLRMLDYDSIDLLLMKTLINHNITKDENLISVEIREFKRIAHEQGLPGLNIEEDGFNILDTQRSDDSHITDEKEKNEYNMGDFTRDEVDDELYGGDEDDDFIDDENFGNIFDSDEYDNQYEDQ